MCNACAGEDLFLPCPTAEPKEAQEKATRLSPISVPYQKKNGSYARKAKGEETVVLSSSEFLGEITAYLLGFTRADCCVTVRGKATLHFWRCQSGQRFHGRLHLGGGAGQPRRGQHRVLRVLTSTSSATASSGRMSPRRALL